MIRFLFHLLVETLHVVSLYFLEGSLMLLILDFPLRYFWEQVEMNLVMALFLTLKPI